MLGSEACPLTGEFAQAFRMHALGAGRVEADGAQAGQLLDHACEGTMAWGPRRLTRPGEHAHRSALFDQQQRIEGLGLFRRQVAGQLLSDTPLGQHRRGRNQLLDDGRAGCDQTVPAQLIHERRGDRRGTRGGNRHWHQPGQGLAAARGREVGEAECLAQGIELLVAGLEPLGVSSERRWFGAELLGDKAERFGWDQLTRPQQASRIAECAELQGEAEAVAVTPTSADLGEIGGTQGPVPDQALPLGR